MINFIMVNILSFYGNILVISLLLRLNYLVFPLQLICYHTVYILQLEENLPYQQAI